MASLRPSFRVLNWLTRLAMKPIEVVGHEGARAQLRANAGKLGVVFGKPAPLREARDEVIAGVPVRRYVPHDAEAGLVVFFHGGGWVVGDLVSHDRVCRALAAASRREVVAVDYRLAPEHRFPAAIDDALGVTLSLAQGQRVVVAGDSAGGHLAAVVARRCAAEGSVLAGQLLVYPVTDAARESGSYERFSEGYFLTRATMRYFRESFLPEVSSREHPDASPLRAPAAKTAPAFVLLADCDVLHDEGLAYAEKLRSEGSSVTVDEVSGAIHGFFSMQGLEVSRAAMARAAAWVRGTLA